MWLSYSLFLSLYLTYTHTPRPILARSQFIKTKQKPKEGGNINFLHLKKDQNHITLPYSRNLDSILKGRDIILPTKVPIVKAMVFPVFRCGCESWTIKKAEHQRIDAFELWCWRRLLRVPWSVRRSNQSILKEISPEYSLEGLMLKLKLQYFGHLVQRANSWKKTLMLGKTESRRRRS